MDCEAEKLGISSPPPYLSLSKNDDALLNGVNYASGGAGILNDTGLYFVIFFSFLFRTFFLALHMLLKFAYVVITYSNCICC